MAVSTRKLTILLQKVVPRLMAGARAWLDTPKGTTEWKFFLYVSSDLAVLETNILELTGMTGHELLKYHTNLEELLELFESRVQYVAHPDEITRYSTTYAYPKLESWLEGDVTKLRLPYLTNTEQHKPLYDALTSLNELLQISSVDVHLKKFKKSSLDWGAREWIKKVHHVLTQCCCQGAHESMIFSSVSANRSPNASSIVFDLMMKETLGPEHSWTEAALEISTTHPRALRFVVQGDENVNHASARTTANLCDIRREQNVSQRVDIKVFKERLGKGKHSDRITALDDFEALRTIDDLISSDTVVDEQKRLLVALLVVYAALFYCGTPWILTHWSRSNFRFLRSALEKEPISNRLRPLLIAASGCNAVENLPQEDSSKASSDRLTLATILLEIYCQDRIDCIATSDDDEGPVTEDDQYAYAILQKVRRICSQQRLWDVYTGYQTAVNALLYDDDVQSLSWNDQQHYQYLHDRVLEPIQQDILARADLGIGDLMRILQPFSRNEVLNLSESGPTVSQISIPGSSKSGRRSRLHDMGPLPHAESSADIRLDRYRQKAREAPSIDRWRNDPALQEFQFSLFDDHDFAADASKNAMKWLEDMEKVHGIQRELLTASGQTSSSRATSPIRVAVLDTGFDDGAIFMHDPRFRGRVKERKNFAQDHSSSTQDTHGHGTFVTHLILQVARNAEVYVAKIAEDEEGCNAEDVCRAIRHSTTKWKAHIVSMSFGFSDTGEEHDCVRHAILETTSRIEDHGPHVLFAAASNGGGLKGVTFPASHQNVIAIGSFDGLGTPSLFNPIKDRSLTLGTLGEGVKAEWLGGQRKTKSGTSFATPIAAAVAATMMDYVSQS